MKFIKKNIKLIVGIIIGMLLVSGISVYATYKYFASDVSYTKSDGTEISVADALNDLYRKETIIVDDLEKLTDGISCDNDYFYVYTPNEIKWNETELENINYKKMIYCHKAPGNNTNFTATLPFSLDSLTLDVKLIKKIGDYGFNPSIRIASGNTLNVDLNYGYPELAEYYFIIEVK